MVAILPPDEKFFTVGIFKKNISKYAKLMVMVEPYICDNSHQIYRFFFYLYQEIFEIHLDKKSSARQQTNFFVDV